MGYSLNRKVCVKPADEYDAGLLKPAILDSFRALDISLCDFSGKKVVIKPNLVMKAAPEKAATTHPVVLETVISVLNDYGIEPVIAESPGGVYSEMTLRSVYRECGIDQLPGHLRYRLNYDTSSGFMDFPEGVTCKRFAVIRPILEADLILDLCKLKTHALTTLSAGVKNFYGVVPGITKFEMHSAFPNKTVFSSMICDLAAMICKSKKVICITDGIVGMEGEGPTGGDPRKIGALLVSESPFSSDVIAAKLIGLGTEDVEILKEAVNRGYIPSKADEIDIEGVAPEKMVVPDFRYSSTHGLKALRFFSTGWVGKLFMPTPHVSARCRGCGKCAMSCPKKTIRMVNGKAKINPKNCIRCYCCQELCPFQAIDIRRNPVIGIINSIK